MQRRAVGIVIFESEILLMGRNKFGRRYYSFPGGGIEDGETPEECVVREIKEETCLNVSVEKPLYNVTMKHSDGSQKEDFYFLCRVKKYRVPKLDPNSIESQRAKIGDLYFPKWRSISDIAKINLYPEAIKESLLYDLSHDFKTNPKNLVVNL